MSLHTHTHTHSCRLYLINMFIPLLIICKNWKRLEGLDLNIFLGRLETTGRASARASFAISNDQRVKLIRCTPIEPSVAAGVKKQSQLLTAQTTQSCARPTHRIYPAYPSQRVGYQIDPPLPRVGLFFRK